MLDICKTCTVKYTFVCLVSFLIKVARLALDIYIQFMQRRSLGLLLAELVMVCANGFGYLQCQGHRGVGKVKLQVVCA